ncbi:MAG TPA: threonine synthase [Candidatus Saccharicenans sp.]|jgi:threonine synthase|nr:threonine synthase [Candidatus Saccharicenans sp.]HRD01172.1 threonine synthase [Candidatus Saccharicenans sp.]
MNKLTCFYCSHEDNFLPNDILCPACGQPLLFDSAQFNNARILIEEKIALKKFQNFLPLEKVEPDLSLKEGSTPLLRLSRLEKSLNQSGLTAKLEAANPTLSFKDRGTAVVIQKLAEMKVEKIGTVSTGNMASSTAAYAARNGLQAFLLVKKGTSAGALISSAVFEPIIIEIEGDYGQLFYKSYQLGKRYGIYFANSVDPLRIEGYKLTSFEICQQLGQSPDFVFVPLSSGGHLIGLYKGFLEFKQAGLIKACPTFVGVQAEGCSPIVQAFNLGEDRVKKLESTTTLAHSISNPDPPAGQLVLKMIRENNGQLVSVTDQEMFEAQKLLATKEGLFVQPEAATTLAAYLKLKEKLGGQSVLVLTGHGLKATELPAARRLEHYQVCLEEVDSLIEQIIRQ